MLLIDVRWPQGQTLLARSEDVLRVSAYQIDGYFGTGGKSKRLRNATGYLRSFMKSPPSDEFLGSCS